MERSSREDARSRIVAAAAQLLHERGPSAITTRGVADAAGVQAPAIYRLFGDKEGLLDAVAEHLMRAFVELKAGVVADAEARDVDPLVDLRAGWDAQLEFGLANPSIFRFLSAPTRPATSPALQLGRKVLQARVHRIAASGRLCVSEQRAVEVIQAAGIGVIQLLLSTPPEQRDPGLADALYTAVLGQILTVPPKRAPGTVTAIAVAFRAIVPELNGLTGPERKLLSEWLDRAISGSSQKKVSAFTEAAAV